MTWKSDIETVRDFVMAALRTFEWLETIPRTNMHADIIGLRDVVLPRLKLISDRIEELERDNRDLRATILAAQEVRDSYITQLQAAQQEKEDIGASIGVDYVVMRAQLEAAQEGRDAEVQALMAVVASKSAEVARLRGEKAEALKVLDFYDGDEMDPRVMRALRAALTPEGTQGGER